MPLSLQFARSGVPVLGLHIDIAKVEALQAGRSYIKHITDASIAEQVGAGRFAASTDFSRVREVSAVIIGGAHPAEQEPRAGSIPRTSSTPA